MLRKSGDFRYVVMGRYDSPREAYRNPKIHARGVRVMPRLVRCFSLLVFVSTTSFGVAADKPAKVRLSGDNFSKHATWAPSEKIYLWLKADDGSLQMHAVDPASDAAPEPVKNHAGNMNTDPQVSGDGKKIVFASTRG